MPMTSEVELGNASPEIDNKFMLLVMVALVAHVSFAAVGFPPNAPLSVLDRDPRWRA